MKETAYLSLKAIKQYMPEGCILLTHCYLNVFFKLQVPNLCWRDVVPEMDYEGFHLPSLEGLSIIMTAYTAGSKDPFPIDMIYGPWVHTSGQVIVYRYFVQCNTIHGCN